MKTIQSAAAIVLILLFCSACKKERIPGNINESLPTGMMLANGNFVSTGHPTNGMARIIQDAGGKKFLVIENFQTDSGPDLRVWLSPNNNASTYQELGTLKAVTGSFYYELDNSINYMINNRVLIWCEDFSVLFGYAVLL